MKQIKKPKKQMAAGNDSAKDFQKFLPILNGNKKVWIGPEIIMLSENECFCHFWYN
jgi:hypothetical protein